MNGNDITYFKSAGGSGRHEVYLNGRRAGVIEPCAGGFRYVTSNGDAGEAFPTVAEVKASLEGESDGN